MKRINFDGKNTNGLSKRWRFLSIFPKLYIFRFNDNKSRYPPKQSLIPIGKRCKTKVVEKLPVEILIEIFGFVLEPNCLRVWNDNECNLKNYAPEDQRRFLRLTCRKWNTILIELLDEMDIDLSRTKSLTLEGNVLHPPTLKRLRIFNGRYSNNDIQVDQWLDSSNLSRLQSLSFEGCSELTTHGLTNINNHLKTLKILNCPLISQASLISLFSRLEHLTTLTINTEQYFTDHELINSMELSLPRLETLNIVISYKNYKAVKLDQNGSTTIQYVSKRSFPCQIKELILSQDLPECNNRVLTSYDYERMGPICDYSGIKHQIGFQSDENPYPSLKKLDISQCSFAHNLFMVPQTLTHLTVSYPSMPMDHLDAKLPFTLECLKISGYVYHTAFEKDSQIMYHSYGERWVQLLPDNAPFLHTLILHLYVLSPKNLYTIINDRYSTSLRHLDLCVFFTIITGLGDACSCSNAICSLGQCHRRSLMGSLINLHDLKLHNKVDDDDIDSLPSSLKNLWLYNGYKAHISKSAMKRAFKRGIVINELSKGLFGCSESNGRCGCMLLRSSNDIY